MNRKNFLCAAITALFGPAMSTAMAQAAPYPSKPIRVVAPFPPGGGVDVIARMVGDKLQADWGQPMVIDNRPGAGTLIGAQAVATAAPDGYTILAATVDTLAVASTLQSHPITIPEKTLTPITQIVRTPLLFAVRPDSPYKTLAQFVEAARAKPGTLTFGSAGLGTLHHMSMEMFSDQANIKLTHVAYRGSSPALADLLAGVLDIVVLESPLALGQLKGGKVRALAITTEARSSLMPDVPTVAEQGYPGYAALSWMGFALPRGTPQPILDKLFEGITKAIMSPDVSAKLRGIGLEPTVSKSPEDFARYADAERARWTALIKAKNIQVD